MTVASSGTGDQEGSGEIGVDKILTSFPINETAARVTSKGVHWEPQKKIQTQEADAPFPMKKPPLNIKDVTGHRFGRFSVLGYSADGNSKWVCRCDCGRYALRKTRAVLNKENGQDRCELCRHLSYLKRNEVWKRTGKDPDIRNF